MRIYPFKAIHLMPVWEDGIGFPSVFFPVVEETRTVILTRKENSLIGYCPEVWEGLKESIYSRYARMDLAPVMIRDFIGNARACRVDIIHESKPSNQQNFKSLLFIGLAPGHARAGRLKP